MGYPGHFETLFIFELYRRFYEQGLNPAVHSAQEPMIEILDVKGKDYAVYVVRDSVEELMLQLKWDEKLRYKRIIVFAELSIT